MSSRAMSLKAKIKNLAKEKNMNAQVLHQNFVFERFLERLSISEYKDSFILKGGMLVAGIVGVDIRSTMDLDATIRGLALSEFSLRNIIQQICSQNVQDNMTIVLGDIIPIRPDDIYGGYRVKAFARYDSIDTPFSIDISTGDVITPQPVKYSFRGMFDKNKIIEIWAYNIETVLAEKIETILSRGTLSTRPRDFYDVYILSITQQIDKDLLKQALTATAEHRGTISLITDTRTLLTVIENSSELMRMWEKYRHEFVYAAEITYTQVLQALKNLIDNY